MTFLNLIQESKKLNLEFFIQVHSAYIDIHLDKGLVSIERRNSYCDRGRYLIKVFSSCVKTFYVDDQDAFPRYYFVFDNLVSELTQWFQARNVNIISIKKMTWDFEKNTSVELNND